MQFQQTIKRSVACHGIGIHSGRPAHLVIHPAPANSGLNFIRTDLPGSPVIPARSSRVVDSSLATTLGNREAYVSTVEHLLAALAGMKIDNARIELSGPELPILDGSAAPFTVLVQKAGKGAASWRMRVRPSEFLSRHCAIFIPAKAASRCSTVERGRPDCPKSWPAPPPPGSELV